MNRNDMAFPGMFKGFDNDDQFAPGLTMRDHIATQAMPQLINGCMGFCPTTNPDDMNKSNAEAMSKMAYLIADAMIAESEKDNE